MKFFKNNYDNSYFKTFIDIDIKPIKRMDIQSKIKMIRSLKNSGRLLEIGCGTGKLLNELQKYYSVFGIDISPYAISEASKTIINKNLNVLDIEKGKIIGNYDIIIAFDILEHLNNPKNAIIKIKKSLKESGIFILSVPNNYGLYGKIITRVFNFIDKTHISTFNRNFWIKILQEEGFDMDIRNQSWFGIFKSDISKNFTDNLLIIAKK